MKKSFPANSPTKMIAVAVFSSLLTYLSIPSLASDIPPVPGTTTNKSNNDDIALATTETFAIGMIGFVGHISPGESAYRNILKEPDAQSRFYAIFKSSDSTNAAKLYSACGLKTLSSLKFKEVERDLRTSKEQVSTMKADVMRKEAVSEIMKGIDRFGC
ncbi:MchS3 family protein [Collimonas sp.]|jgi:hypothetical protein|uniref:MchS3 family protein n=1 Tax=Collimonas sp. TaxID=1963772 RepID=UPI002BD5F66D|nr:MchS3 family protein [Collimonas sp.]HWW07984.1 MchS3 family protein [Collimonas sp.]